MDVLPTLRRGTADIGGPVPHQRAVFLVKTVCPFHVTSSHVLEPEGDPRYRTQLWARDLGQWVECEKVDGIADDIQACKAEQGND